MTVSADVHEKLRESAKLAVDHPCLTNFLCELERAYLLGKQDGREQQITKAVTACVDMAERYDADIEGCDADELIEYCEGITCSLRLAYIIKYGTFPPKGDAWSHEIRVMFEAIRAAAIRSGETKA